MSVDSAILATIEKLYAAALDESRWTEVMQDFLQLTDSVGATFCVIDGSDQPRFSAFATLQFEQKFIDEYLQGMMLHDPTVQYIVAHPNQRLVHDSQIISEREKDRHMYYDWHHSFSDTRHRLAGMASLEQSVTSGITVHRTRAQGDYHPAHIERFDFLLPHLERAVSIGFRLGAFGAMQQMSFQMLDANPFAIIVLDELGKPIFVNRAARDVVSAQDGLVLSGNGLSSGHHGDNQKLQQLIRRALALANGETAEPAGAMHALRRSGKRPYSILVSPICQARSLLGRVRPAVCIVIADPERRAQLPERTLRILYGLTPAEVRLASQIANGTSVQNAAEALSISYKTARTQLAAIFKKTATTRQGELVKLLLAEVPLI